MSPIKRQVFEPYFHRNRLDINMRQTVKPGDVSID